MTSGFELKTSGDTNPFDEFFIETHKGSKATWEDTEDEDVDFDTIGI